MRELDSISEYQDSEKFNIKVGDKVQVEVPEQYDRETYEGTLVEIDGHLGKVEFENGLWRWDYLRKIKKVENKKNKMPETRISPAYSKPWKPGR